jgi:uncharacterized membrane protein (DUF485 family)
MNPVAMGNALGGAAAILFLACGLLAYMAPDLLIGLAQSFVHTLNLAPLTAQKVPFDFGQFALGWVVLSAYLWIFGWLLGTIYNATRGREAA